MPLTGTGAVLGAAMLAARDAAVASFMAGRQGRALTTAEVASLRQSIAAAEATALLAHIVANGQVVVASVSGVTTGAGVSGPGAGTIT